MEKEPVTRSDFPEDFLWGASTASHQVEGGTHNQWSEWEQQHADELARQAENKYGKLENWPAIREQATDPANYISGPGVDHYNRYEEDFDILQQLNMNGYRFGIEWSRVQPASQEWDEEAIQHYHEYIAALKQRGITPVLNLWHWTMPTWFTDKGGFASEANIPDFIAYVRRMAQEFGGEVEHIITLNEPNVYSSLGYLDGTWPPQRKSPLTAFRVYRNLAKTHRQAYEVCKSICPDVQVGIAQNLVYNMPKHPWDIIAAQTATYGWNWWFLDRIRQHQDFIGCNFYFTHYVSGVAPKNPTAPVNDLGWYMEPGRLNELLQQTHKRYGAPILITENGLADASDAQRQWWLEETITAMHQAMQAGVDLRGYLHWSLLDNFEWADGWWPHFGLVTVERDNDFKRTVRPSAKWFGAWLENSQK